MGKNLDPASIRLTGFSKAVIVGFTNGSDKGESYEKVWAGVDFIGFCSG